MAEHTKVIFVASTGRSVWYDGSSLQKAIDAVRRGSKGGYRVKITFFTIPCGAEESGR